MILKIKNADGEWVGVPALKGEKGDPGIGAVMDSELSSTSINGVQNKVIKSALDGKADADDIPSLTDYVKNTDYATTTKGGVIKANAGLEMISGGYVGCSTRDYSSYQSSGNALFVSKGTLENVLTNRIPTKTSDLTNDSGFTTFSGSYNDLTNKPTSIKSDYTKDINETHSEVVATDTSDGTIGRVTSQYFETYASDDYPTAETTTLAKNDYAKASISANAVPSVLDSGEISVESNTSGSEINLSADSINLSKSPIVEGHSSAIGYVSPTVVPSADTTVGTSWVDVVDLTLPAGTWIILAQVSAKASISSVTTIYANISTTTKFDYAQVSHYVPANKYNRFQLMSIQSTTSEQTFRLNVMSSASVVLGSNTIMKAIRIA